MKGKKAKSRMVMKPKNNNQKPKLNTAADAAEPLPVSSTAQLRDLAASAGRVFGWDSGRDNGRSGDTHNTLIVTTEQLQLMRELCDADEPYKKPAISERDAISAITTEA